MQQQQPHSRFSQRRITDVGDLYVNCVCFSLQETHAQLTPSLALFSYLYATSFSPLPHTTPSHSLSRPVVKYAQSSHKACQTSPSLSSPHSPAHSIIPSFPICQSTWPHSPPLPPPYPTLPLAPPPPPKSLSIVPFTSHPLGSSESVDSRIPGLISRYAGMTAGGQQDVPLNPLSCSPHPNLPAITGYS